MKVVDLNILLYAVNADAPEHIKAHQWWESTLGEDEPVGISWTVILGFLRLATRAGVLPRPLTPTQALDTVQEWIEHPLVSVLEPGPSHWPHLRALVEKAGLAGNLTTDAHLAALTMEYQATLYSTDSDFTRFASLRVRNPLD